MKKLTIIGAFVLGLGIAPLAAQEKVVLGGAGTLGDATEILAKAYKQKHSGDAVDVIPESMSTTGGMEGTRAGRLTIGIVTRPVNDKEKKDGLVYRTVARVPVVVGIHKSLPVENLTESQVCDIFSGKIKSWKEVGGSDGKITVLGRKRDDNNVEVLREKMACFKNLQLTADAVLLVRGTEVLDSLNNRPGTVGISTAGPVMATRKNVKPTAIGGASPTLESVRSNKYKFYNEIGFVTVGEPKGAAKRFIDFVMSADGEKLLEKQGAAIVR
jgi:phosphate transport system substrate-binding protein